MKRVKIMLSAICVMAVVAGALAFKAKSPDVCAYSFSTTTTTLPIQVQCSRAVLVPTTASVVIITDVATRDKNYATTIQTVGGQCTLSTTLCSKSRTLADEGAND